MPRTYQLIDSDGHILEPQSLWNDYIDPAFRERAPRIVADGNGRERLSIDGVLQGRGLVGIGIIGAPEVRKTGIAGGTPLYRDGHKGGFDPHARIADMDLDGIDAAFLYPSLGLFLGSVQDAPLAAAICRAYNRWLADYCKPYPDRLFGVAMLPLQSIELAIEEMRFAREKLGFRAAFIRPNPYHGKMVHHPSYEPFWAEACELDLSIAFHEGTTGGMTTVGVDRFETRGGRHIVSHTMEMMLASLSVIWGGVCERHPKLRVAFLESGGGWIAPWLDRMDRHFEDKDFNDSGLKSRPSEIFQRSCWISFEPVEKCLGALAEYIGPHKILWATDYPHPDGFFPGAPAMVAGILRNASAETRRQVLAGGAMGFYRLDS